MHLFGGNLFTVSTTWSSTYRLRLSGPLQLPPNEENYGSLSGISNLSRIDKECGNNLTSRLEIQNINILVERYRRDYTCYIHSLSSQQSPAASSCCSNGANI